MIRSALAIGLALVLLVIVATGSKGGVSDSDATDGIGSSVGPLCFYRAGHLVCFHRAIQEWPSASGATPVEVLLEALLAGPTPEEQRQGVRTALPSGVRLVSVQTDAGAEGPSVTVRLAFPAGYLAVRPVSEPQEGALPPEDAARLDALAVEAIQEQIVHTLFPLGYRQFFVDAADPLTPGLFQPLSAYLPAVTIPSKGNKSVAKGAETVDGPVQQPASQHPLDVQGRPRGALTGKTVYVSAGHGWDWKDLNWHTQRPPYPDASTGYYGPIIEDHNNAEVVNQYLVRYLWNAGADVWTTRERDLNSFGQNVDTESGDVKVAGQWGTVGQGGYRGSYLQTSTTLTGTAAVTWSIGPVVADGTYALYLWYADGPDRAEDAQYTVYHAGGATEFSLDQRRHGYTWRFVGRYPVHAGKQLVVSLSDRSSTPGQVLVADALQLGGGWFEDGDLATNGGPVETEAPYAADKPWWEMAAFYHVQRLGLNPNELAYYNDIVARPFWARWEHAGTGDEAVYVSWHSNGYNGHNTTTWGTVSYIHNFQPVPGSAELRDAIHNELINDARTGWDVDWRDLGTASRDLGELRELWDDSPPNGIPGALIEVAYHDHIANTDALKDPRFALLSARAVYQGIVKYFGQDLALLPEPPTHLSVHNNGPGQVVVSWRPSPTDSLGLVGHPAESYRVYTSRDGLGWDNGRSVQTTQAVITGLQTNELIFVRVTAVNAGGESFATPVLAARSDFEGLAQMLLVDGFDRIDRHGLVLENDPTEGVNARLFPEEINRFDSLVRHALVITLPFDSSVNEAVRDGDLDLRAYRVVDWMLGEESSVDHTFDLAEQAVVAAFLDDGRGLFVSGAEVGWDLVTRENGPDFFRTYLRADMVGDDAGTYMATPTASGLFAGLGPIAFRESYDVDFPDQLSPRDGSLAALDYLGGLGGIAGIQYDAGGCRRVVYLGFPFEAIDPLSSPAVMARVLGYLGADGCVTTAPGTLIASPVMSSAFNTIPAFYGTAGGVHPISRVEVQFQDPDGRYWDGLGWTATPVWLQGQGTTAWQYVLDSSTLMQGEHHVWARAWDTQNQVDPAPAFAAFVYDTIPPAAPMLLAPANGTTFTAGPVTFEWEGPLEDTGSTLGYYLQIEGRVFTLVTTHHTPLAWPTAGAHTWQVRAFDAAGNRSNWTPLWTFFMATFDAHLPVILRK